jgi:hypothetical protein
LTNKTVENGATEAEAMSAMGMVGKLLRQYNLTMNELDVRQSAFKTINLFVKDRENRHPTFDALATSLARLIDGKTWFHKELVKNSKNADGTYTNGKYAYKANGNWKKRGGYAFFGAEHDLELVEYLFNVIANAVVTESKAFKRTEAYTVNPRNLRKRAFNSFLRGMGTRLSQRLSEMKRENDKVYEEALRATGEAVVVNGETIRKPTGTNLIVLKGQLTEQEFKKTGIRLHSVHSYIRRNDYNAFSKGFVAGDNVNLSRPISNGNKTAGYIT